MRKDIIEIDLDNVKKPFRNFIKKTIKQAKEHDVRVILTKKRHVIYDKSTGAKSNGYFCGDEDPDGAELAVACGQPFKKWFSVFIHESSHMDQWIEHDPLYHDEKEYHGNTGGNLIELWLDHKIELNRKQLNEYMASMRDIEADCEMRAAKKIIDEGLPMDVEYYTKRANSYIYFYNYMMATRSWYKIGKEPYNIPEIVAGMPSTFAESYEKFPKKIKAIFAKHMK